MKNEDIVSIKQQLEWLEKRINGEFLFNEALLALLTEKNILTEEEMKEIYELIRMTKLKEKEVKNDNQKKAFRKFGSK